MREKPVLKPLGEQSIVVTGATSGVGLATVRRAARAGARVFLIARGERDLRALCEELQAQGARVAWAVADVADPEALKAAVEKCVRLFGGFDTWVNNAGVGMFGSIRETRLEDQRRLFETNYWGVVNGSLAAAEHLRTRPGGGAIINVGSILSDLPLPVQGVYAASKHAVKGFTNALRIELMREQAPVTVSRVKPGAIDTPYSRHARNLTGQAVHNPQPVYATHVVADTILDCAAHPNREGRDLLQEHDAAGKQFHKDFIGIVRESGSGWVDYMFPRPRRSTPEVKWSYVCATTVEDVPALVGAGVYVE